MSTQINKLKKNYKKLEKDANSILFAKDEINNNLIKKLKKSCYDKDKLFINLYIKLENINDLFEKSTMPTKTSITSICFQQVFVVEKLLLQNKK